MVRRITLALIWVAMILSTAPAACGSSGTDPADGAVVTFAFQGRTDTMLVLMTDPATISAAEARVRTGRGPNIPIGPIARGAGIDPRYPFHFIADSVRLAEVAIELCDAAPMRTVAEVDAFFLGSTGNPDAARATWCPWAAYPVAVER
jgi:hypothetical protein